MSLCRVQWCARKADAPLLRSPVLPLSSFVPFRGERESGAAVGRMRIRCCRDDGFVGQIPENKVHVYARGRCRERKNVECWLSSRHHRMSLASFEDRLPLNQSISSRTEGSRARTPGEAFMEEDGISPSGLSRSIAKRCKGMKP